MFVPDEAIAILERTPGTLDALLVGLPEGWLSSREGRDTWSPREVVGHLIHGEKTDWIPRMKIILSDGGTFEPFDRRAQEQRMGDEPIRSLLDEFRVLRTGNLDELRDLVLDDELLDRTGTHPDPEIGVVTLRQLLSTWVVHDLAHLSQIARAMQSRWREEIGPWTQYFSLFSGEA